MPGVSLTTIPYPFVNGVRQSFCSMELKTLGIPFMGIASANYSWEVKREEVHGTHPDPLGVTRGQASYTFEAEFYLAEYNLLIATIGNGFAETPMTATATYSETGLDTICDTIQIVGLDKGDGSQSNDSKAITRKVTFHAIKIWPNGFDLWNNPLKGFAASAVASAVGGAGGLANL